VGFFYFTNQPSARVREDNNQQSGIANFGNYSNTV
jgi:hypothetical protein